MLFEGTPLKYSNLGEEKYLTSISKKDLMEFWQKSYLASNSVVSVWGGVTPQKAERIVKKYFGSMKSGEWKEPQLKFASKKKVNITKRDSSQITIVIAFRLERNPELTHVCRMVKNILCSGMISRIPYRLRIKESLIYSWGTGYSLDHDSAYFTISLGTTPSALARVMDALAQEIRNFKLKGPKQREIKHHKDIIAKAYSWSMEGAGDYANWYVDDYLHNPEHMISPQEYLKKIQSVRQEQIMDFVNTYFTKDRLYLSLVGPFDAKRIELEV